MMRTNVVIDNHLMKQAMDAGHFHTKKEAITAGLNLIVQLHKQTLVRKFRGKLKWEGDLNKMRLDNK